MANGARVTIYSLLEQVFVEWATRDHQANERFLWLLDQLLATNADYPYLQRRILRQARDHQYIGILDVEELLKKHNLSTLDKKERGS